MKTKIIHKGKKPWPGRVYREQDGNYVSVTSVIHPEGLDFPERLLKQYGGRGSIVHAQVEEFLKTGFWLSPEEAADPTDLSTVLEGSLKLSITACNAKGFFDAYGENIEHRYIEQKLINRTHRYGGRADIIGKYIGEWAIMDVKTAGNYSPEKLIDYWMQQSAYAKCVKGDKIKRMVILPINPKSSNGYDAPIVETNIDHYFDLFLKKLKYAHDTYIISNV